MFRLFEFLSRQALQFMSNMTDLFEMAIHSPFQSLVRGRDESVSMTVWILLWPFRVIGALFAALFWLLLLPIRLLMTITAPRRVDLLWGIPAILILSLIGFVGYRILIANKSVEDNYRKMALQAWESQDYPKAQALFGKLVNHREDPSERDRYFWAISLLRTGETKRASAIIDSLAPNDRPGFWMAHSLKATELVKIFEREKDIKILPTLRFHLENSGTDNSPKISRAWVLLYTALGQPEKAIKHLESAAKIDPRLWLTAADIYRRVDDADGVERSLNMAKDVFGQKISEDPFDEPSRILYAGIFAQLKDFERAESILLEGVKLNSTPVIRRLCADFYAMRSDVAAQEGRPFVEQFEFLRKSIVSDVNYPSVYERLIRLYERSGDEGKAITHMLEESIAAGKSTAFAHFALSNIFWMDDKKDKARWHIETAYSIDKSLLMVANNFSWMVTHSADPDLDLALKIIEEVVDREPANPRYRDTYGTVLMKMERDEDAIVQFEKCLRNILNKAPVHEKLEVLYRRIGNTSIADLHKEQFEKAKVLENIKNK